MKFILLLTVCLLCGCNMQTSAIDAGGIDEGVQLSDFGGNVAFAADDQQSESSASALASYSTSFNSRDAARLKNIELASNAVDKMIIPPGGMFSFNEAVGPSTKERGFKLSRIFIKGKDAEGYGGGICQVSSTLYNAALEAGLEVIERHQHSKPVGYVPEGMDATASYGGKDLKLGNNRDFSVMINSRVDDGKVIVEINQA